MNKFNKGLLFLGALAAPALCFAEGSEIAAGTIDSALTDLQTGVTGVIGKVATVVGAIVVAGLVIWAIPFAWRKMRGGVGR